MGYFNPKAAFALIPGDSQKNPLNIGIVFQGITREVIVFSSLYRYCLINPLCACSVAC